MSNKVLICGLGRMGNIHKKYLDMLNINYAWYDPFINLDEKKDTIRVFSLKDISANNFTHVIISTPEGSHYDVYTNIKNGGFRGKFLIEKPVIINQDNDDIFQDDSVYCGMVERFNPVICELKKRIDTEKIISIDFIRCSIYSQSIQRVNSFIDVGIHDIDLYFYLTNINNIEHYSMEKYSNTFSLTVLGNTPQKYIVRFLWSNETFARERKIVVRQSDCTYEVDLIDETIKKNTRPQNIIDCRGVLSENLYIEKSSPIRNQLENFMREKSNSVCAKDSHKFYNDIVSRF
jgi:hypothetical protein